VDTTNPTGLDLKLERVASRVKQHQMASVMGVSASRIAAIEREAYPSDTIVRRYRAALGACQNVPHTASAA
jgi:transcriptional regulator with XRE-family HTH domain